MADDGDEWLTHAQAAIVLGLTRKGVGALVERGALPSAGQRGPGRGSIRRVDAERVRDERARAAADRAARRAAAVDRHCPRPPDDDHDWLTTGQAATLLGITATAVKQRCNKGQLPFEWNDRQRWIRRDHLELQVRARDAQRTRLGSHEVH